MPDLPRPVTAAGEGVARHPVVQHGARLGYAVSGALHILMGVLALRLALGDTRAEPDQSGALTALAATPVGWLLLGLCLLGFLLLAVWQGVQVVRRNPVGGRGRAAAKAIVYLVLAGGALGFLIGRPSSSVAQTSDITARLLAWPLGWLLVAVVGVAVVGVGCFHLVKGARQSFRDDLVEDPGRGVVVLGMVGFLAKGLALIAVGALFVQASWTHDPTKSTGLDGALNALLRLPAGSLLVGAVGLGFAAYGLYSFARARYAHT